MALLLTDRGVEEMRQNGPVWRQWGWQQWLEHQGIFGYRSVSILWCPVWRVTDNKTPGLSAQVLDERVIPEMGRQESRGRKSPSKSEHRKPANEFMAGNIRGWMNVAHRGNSTCLPPRGLHSLLKRGTPSLTPLTPQELHPARHTILDSHNSLVGGNLL